MLTQARLKELFNYDPETGLFTRRVANGRHSRWAKDSIAGKTSKQSGYTIISVDGKQYQAHRVIWLYVTGEWPNQWLDHIDRNRSNNRFLNLREATTSQNACNSVKHKDNKSQFKGVTWDESKQNWMARICINYKTYYLGRYDTERQAANAYNFAVPMFHKNFARVS